MMTTDATPPTDERTVQILCVIVRCLSDVGAKLDDVVVLVQQQTDLLRRIVSEEHAP